VAAACKRDRTASRASLGNRHSASQDNPLLDNAPGSPHSADNHPSADSRRSASLHSSKLRSNPLHQINSHAK
jgi:hypothetical protein